MDQLFDNKQREGRLRLRKIQMDIMSKLPMKSLIKFKAVSKNWASLIGDPNYVRLQSSNKSKLKPNLHHQDGIANTIFPKRRELHILIKPRGWDDDRVLQLLEFGVLEYPTSERKKLVEYCVLQYRLGPPLGFIETYLPIILPVYMIWWYFYFIRSARSTRSRRS